MGNEIEAKKMLQKIYPPKGVLDFVPLIDQKYNDLNRSTTKEVGIGLCPVMFGKKYRRASWTGIVLNTLHNLTG